MNELDGQMDEKMDKRKEGYVGGCIARQEDRWKDE